MYARLFGHDLQSVERDELDGKVKEFEMWRRRRVANLLKSVACVRLQGFQEQPRQFLIVHYQFLIYLLNLLVLYVILEKISGQQVGREIKH